MTLLDLVKTSGTVFDKIRIAEYVNDFLQDKGICYSDIAEVPNDYQTAEVIVWNTKCEEYQTYDINTLIVALEVKHG